MRWFHLAVIILFAAVVLVFALQNFEWVTLSFLGMSIRTPLAVLIVVIYLLGTVTGGTLIALVRRSMRGARGPSPG